MVQPVQRGSPAAISGEENEVCTSHLQGLLWLSVSCSAHEVID
jgi:hypothetical protein